MTNASSGNRFVAGGSPRFLADILHPDANSFGVVRLAMAIAVLVSHSFLLRYGTTAAEPLTAWTGFSLSEHAVQVFFFLSGVLIAQSIDRSRSLRAFLVARTLRIFPALIVCVLLTACVLGPMVSTLGWRQYFGHAEFLGYIAKTLALVTGSAPLPGVFTDLPAAGSVNLSVWTLKYEVVCYLAVAALGLAGMFNRRIQFPATVALTFAVFSVFINPNVPSSGYSTLENVRYFFLFFGMGTLAYLLREQLRLRPSVAAVLFALYVAAMPTRFGTLCLALFLGYATLVVAAFAFGALGRFTREHDYSYGTYLFAAPVQQTLLWALPGLDPMVLTLWALAATLVLAALSWSLVERPAMAARARWSGTRVAAAATAVVAPTSVAALAEAVAAPQAEAAPVAFRWPARRPVEAAPRVFAEGPAYQSRIRHIADASSRDEPVAAST